jgi:hypothetical protein
MDIPEKNPAAVSLGRAGGLARAKALSAKRRREIATRASKAAAKARTLQTKERKKARSRAD